MQGARGRDAGVGREVTKDGRDDGTDTWTVSLKRGMGSVDARPVLSQVIEFDRLARRQPARFRVLRDLVDDPSGQAPADMLEGIEGFGLRRLLDEERRIRPEVRAVFLASVQEGEGGQISFDPHPFAATGPAEQRALIRLEAKNDQLHAGLRGLRGDSGRGRS